MSIYLEYLRVLGVCFLFFVCLVYILWFKVYFCFINSSELSSFSTQKSQRSTTWWIEVVKVNGQKLIVKIGFDMFDSIVKLLII